MPTEAYQQPRDEAEDPCDKDARLEPELIAEAMGMRYGGKMAEVPKPWVRRWPSDARKRRVTITINSWVGISGGARHYYATVEEEQNPVYFAGVPGARFDSGKKWVVCWDDDAAKGRKYEYTTTSKAEAVSWAFSIIDRHFAGHIIEYDGPMPHRKYVGREGD